MSEPTPATTDKPENRGIPSGSSIAWMWAATALLAIIKFGVLPLMITANKPTNFSKYFAGATAIVSDVGTAIFIVVLVVVVILTLAWAFARSSQRSHTSQTNVK